MKTLFSFLLSLGVILQMGAQIVTVSNTNDSGPGSLRQAILDANATGSINAIEFNIPTSDGNYNPSTGVFTIAITSTELPELTNWTITVDGSSQTSFTGNTNSYVFGTGGTVGIDQLPLSTLDGPEIEIVDGQGSLKWGLSIGGRNAVVKNIAISGFGNGWFIFDNANLLARPGAANLRVEACVLGSRAHQSLAPSTDVNGGPNFQCLSANDGVFTNNYVAYGETMGAFFKNGNENWLIEDNEFYRNGLTNDICDGLDMADHTEKATIRGNLFHSNGAVGLDFFNSAGDHLVENNTMIDNGLLGRETPGVRLYGSKGGLIRKNIIRDNVGAGILVGSSAALYEITENSIFNNGNVLANTAVSTSNQIGIDLLSSSDNHNRGSHPFVTLNDLNDADGGANALVNFPVIDGVSLSGGTLTVRGFAPGGAKIDFYLGDLYPGALVAQGKEFLFSRVEGGIDDLDAGTGSYGPGLLNGKNYGQDQGVPRFEFSLPAPAGFAPGDLLTATALLPNTGTSEFAPAYTASGSLASLSPNLTCVYIDVNGDVVGRFGYHNPNASVINVPVGANNGFTPSPVNRGQPSSFASGSHSGVFEASFPASASLNWTLQGNNVTADINSLRCPADLAVTQSASNNTPAIGSQVTFTVQVANLSAGTPATAVEIGYQIDPNFSFVSAVPQQGSFNSSTGVWSIPQVLNGSPVSMQVTVVVNGNGSNLAAVQSQNQPDPVSSNNSATETLATGSSGGNNGGIESEGSMAMLIAQRNFDRLKSGEHRFYDRVQEQARLSEWRQSHRQKDLALSDLLPASGPQNSSPIVTSPTDLLGITNAVNIFSVDYYTAAQNRLGAILAIETQNEVYNHTKVICDRLNGAELSEGKTVQIKGHSFLLARLDQENQAVDNAVTFVAYEDANGDFSIDARWAQGDYLIPAGSKVYNFQVWSVSESTTIELVEDIIDLMENNGQVSFINASNISMPTVYVKSGFYRDGKVFLDIVNTVGAQEMTIDASLSSFENAPRQSVTVQFILDSSQTEQRIVWNTGYLFDLGFDLSNGTGGGKDVLYLADGPWNRDYERNTGVRAAQFEVLAETGYQHRADQHQLERAVRFSGDLKNYLTLYRMLRPGNGTMDLSDYNQVVFEASLAGMSEIVVTLVSNKIGPWSEQFRATVPVQNAAMNQYYLDFADLRSSLGGQIDLSEIVNLSFSVIGDQQNFKAMSLEIGQVHFSQNGQALSLANANLSDESGFNFYPNPFSESINLDLQLDDQAEVVLELLNISGQRVDFQDYGSLFPGSQSLRYTPREDLKEGVYLLKAQVGDRQYLSRVVYRK